jgi:hypothetical protein
MIAAIVVPLVSPSIFSTADCFDDEDAGDVAGASLVVARLDAAAGFDRVDLNLAVGVATLDNFRAVLFEVLDFDLLIAIWLFPCERQHRVLPLTQARQTLRRGLKG